MPINNNGAKPMQEPVHIVCVFTKAFEVKRSGLGGNLSLYIDDFEWLTMHYDYRYTSNAGQYAFMEKVARENMRPGDTLTIDGQLKS
jgi:hypothetical protein